MKALPVAARLAAVVTAAAALALPAAPAAFADPANTSSFTAPSALTALRLSPGRLWYSSASSATSAPLYRRGVDTTTSPATLGAPAQLLSIGPALAASGTRVVYAESTNTAADVADAATMAVQHRYALPTGYTDVRLSGQKLVIGTPTGVQVTEMPTGAHWSLPAGAAVSGRYAAWYNPDGSITRRDLLTGAQVPVRPAGIAVPGTCTRSTNDCLPTNSPTALKVHNGWVVWRLSCEVGAWQAGTGVVTQTLSSTTNCIRHFQLLDGWLVYQDPGTGALSGQDLSCVASANPCSPVSVVGSAVGKFSAEGESLAWTDTSATTVYVGALPFSYVNHPWVVDESAPPAFSPGGNGVKTWAPEFDLSAPLSSWTLNVKNSSGTLVWTDSGAAPYAAVLASWPGTSAAVQPAGVYSWTLSGADAAGNPLQGSDGGSGQLSGTVVIQNTAPPAAVHSPALSTSRSTSTSFPVSWNAYNVPTWPGYRVTGYDVQVTDNGSTRTWLTATSATSAWFAGAQGHTYRFAVRARDDAGNVGPWSGRSTTTVPLDDRNSALAYGGSWTSYSASSAYLGTERESGSGGSSVTVKTYLSQVSVVATRCSGCGVLRVYIDGRYVGYADTYASSAQYRQTVFVHTVSSTVGLHTVKVVVAGTAGRPRVYLDGIGITR